MFQCFIHSIVFSLSVVGFYEAITTSLQFYKNYEYKSLQQTFFEVNYMHAFIPLPLFLYLFLYFSNSLLFQENSKKSFIFSANPIF